MRLYHTIYGHYLSDGVLHKSINGEHNIGVDTKHLPARVLVRGAVNVTCRNEGGEMAGEEGEGEGRRNREGRVRRGEEGETEQRQKVRKGREGKGSRREEGEERRRAGRGEERKKLIVNNLELNAMYIHDRICTFHVVLGHVEEGGIELLDMDVS